MRSLIMSSLVACSILGRCKGAISNAAQVIDMAQNDPGDYSWTGDGVSGIGWQQSKYFDPHVIKALNYTGRVTTGEISPFLTVTFDAISGGKPFFNSTEMAWVMAARAQAKRTASETKKAGLLWIPFVDMIVFPKAVIERFAAQIVDPNSGKIQWNDACRKIVQAMLNETVSVYGDLLDGILVRTGETYVFDTPYHAGNSPTSTCGQNTSCQQAVWVDFITELRQQMCVDRASRVFFRAWDSFGGWSGDPQYYLNVTNPVEPHDLLYFSVKHTAGDFFQFMAWNQQLAVGKHAQVVEVELQREYEGKGAYPNYIMPTLINGTNQLPDGSDAEGLVDVLAAPQIKGLWTWSRGGGWYGPYVHGHEEWVDVHVYVLQCWWAANYNHAQSMGPKDWGRSQQVMTERDCWDEFVRTQWAPRLGLGLPSPQGDIYEAAKADVQTASEYLRYIAMNGTQSVTNGHYCPEGDYSNCWSWTRDDRLAGTFDGAVKDHLDWLLQDPARLEASARFKSEAIVNTIDAMTAWTDLEALVLAASTEQEHVLRRQGQVGLDGEFRFSSIGSSQSPLLPLLRTSIEYAQHLWTIVDAGWCVMREGWKLDHPKSGIPANTTLLAECGARYWQEWAAYKAMGLFCEHSPSLYRGVYLSLGGAPVPPGLDATVRNYTSQVNELAQD